MNKYKTQIFISSTIKDLTNERIAALEAVNELGAEAIMSEYTINAQNNNSVNTCIDKVKSSDLYILILGGKYGWRPSNDKSITEIEYITAQENNIPILVFNLNYIDKEDLQKEFSEKVGATFFWKQIVNIFQLKDFIVKAVKEEIDKWEKEQKEKTESIYSSLLNISFPEKIYIAEISIDRDEIIKESWNTDKKLKMNASWYDVTVSAIHNRSIRFPHDWTCYKNQILTFHDLSDHNLPLSSVIDLGTVDSIRCEEFYRKSEDAMKVFKNLLRNCLKTKLYKLKINWYKGEKLFAFMPFQDTDTQKWKNREIEWTKIKKAKRTVVKINYSKKNPDKFSSARHLAFTADFYEFENNWFLSVKPDWIVTWKDFKPSNFGFEKIQYIKREEKNLHVFNHLNFILEYIKSPQSDPLFSENIEYPFLKIAGFVQFDGYPIINDENWRKLETKSQQKKLTNELILFSNEN